MAEAFGVGSGIVGVLSLTIQITQTVVQFGLDWKDAPKEVKSFMSELQSLKTVLSETNTNLLNPDFNNAFKGQNPNSVLLSKLGSNAPTATDTSLSIESCKEELTELLAELKKRQDAHRVGWQRLKGPFLAKNTQKAVDKLHRYCQLFNDMLLIDSSTIGAITLREVKGARKEQRDWYNAAESQKILAWLSDLSFVEKQRDILSKRHPGTGEWLLNLDKFKAWRNGHADGPSAQWCPGIPGAGKSVLTSIVVESLQQLFSEEDVAIAYAYCDYKDRKNQTTTHLLSNLVKQLALQHEDLPSEVYDLYTKYNNGQKSLSVDDCSKLFVSFSSHFRRSFILVDALDEHLTDKDEENSLRLRFLDELLGLQRQQGNHTRAYTLFFTSRENRVIEEQLVGCARIDIGATDTDIESYLRYRIQDSRFRYAKKVREDPKLGDTIISTLVQKAQGMFLLPRLQLDQLGCQTSIRGLRQALGSLPTELYDTYDEAMNRIYGQVLEHKELAIRALSWISSALRPLRVDEIQHALAVQPGDQCLDEEGLEDESLIVSVSAGLITIDTESGIIRLTHFTVEEYFKEKKQSWLPDADRLIASTCLTYLSFDVFARNLSAIPIDSYYARDKEDENLKREYRLLEYAANYWGDHVSKETDHASKDLALDFLMSKYKVACAGHFMHFPDRSRPSIATSGMHLAVHFGLIETMSSLIERKAAVDSKNDLGQTPLIWAARKGQEAATKLLLAQDDVAADSQDEDSKRPLLHAARRGHESVVKLLLERSDIAADSQDKYGQTPLFCAVYEGHEAVVRLLLERDDVVADSQDNYGQTPLSHAASRGYESVVKLLLERDDVAVDSKDDEGRTPLLYAAKNGREGVVKLLLERDEVVADSKDSEGRTLLSYAAENGREGVVKLLLERDDVVADSKDNWGRTPLSYAAEEGYEAVVKLLLERDDVVVGSKDKIGKTPLSYAAEEGYKAVVKLLLERDKVGVDSKDNKGKTPLSHAAEWGGEAVVKLLLERDDVVVDSKDDEGKTPLSYALQEGEKAIARLLEAKLAKNNAKLNDAATSV